MSQILKLPLLSVLNRHRKRLESINKQFKYLTPNFNKLPKPLGWIRYPKYEIRGQGSRKIQPGSWFRESKSTKSRIRIRKTELTVTKLHNKSWRDNSHETPAWDRADFTICNCQTQLKCKNFMLTDTTYTAKLC